MREAFVFYRSFRDAIKALEPSDQAIVYGALCDYALDGIEPELEGVPAAMFMLMKPQIDANNKRYENGKKGGRPKKENQTETKEKPNDNLTVTEQEPKEKEKEKDKDKEKDTLKSIQKERFIPPTVEEVKAYSRTYSREKGLPELDAETFVDFYESKGWRVGRDSMKDWRSAARRWIREDAQKRKKGRIVNFTQRRTSYDDLLAEGNW